MTNRSKIEQALKAGKRLTAGIDLGSKHSVACWVDEEGEQVAREKMASSCVALERVFGGLPPIRIAIETGGHANWWRGGCGRWATRRSGRTPSG